MAGMERGIDMRQLKRTAASVLLWLVAAACLARGAAGQIAGTAGQTSGTTGRAGGAAAQTAGTAGQTAATAAPKAEPDPNRFASEIQQFAAWDSKNATPARAVLFVGSSSIRMWATADWFPSLPVINRGFGGSQISDVIHYVNETVLKYDPSVIVFYAGDNDLAGGKTPERVAADFKTFVGLVMQVKPHVQILCIAIKPSILRWAPGPRCSRPMRSSPTTSRRSRICGFVDTSAGLLGPDGKPNAALFAADGLHLNDAGYAIWTNLLSVPIRQALTRSSAGL